MTGVRNPLSALSALRAIAAYGPSYALTALLGLATIPFLSRHLGPAQFGVYGVGLSVHALMLTFASDPTTGALRRLYARADERGDPDRFLRAVFGLALFLAALVALIVALLSLVSALVFASPVWAMRVLVIAAMTAIFAVFQYILTSLYVRERLRASALAQFTHACLKSAAFVIGALVFHTAVGSFGLYAGALSVVVLILFRAVHMPGPLKNTGYWRESLRYGVPLIAVSLGLIVLTGFDRVTLAAVSGDRAAGEYSVVYLLSDFSVQSLGMLLWYAMYPGLVRQWELGNLDNLRRSLRATADVFVICGTTIVAVLASAGSEITSVIAGAQYSVPGTVPMLVGAGVLMCRMAGFEMVGFEFALMSRRLAVTFVAAALVCIPVTIVAVVIGGLIGGAASTTVSFAVFWLAVRWGNPLRSVTSYPIARLALVLAAAAPLVIVARVALTWKAGICLVAIGQPLLAATLLGRWSLIRSAIRPLLTRFA